MSFRRLFRQSDDDDERDDLPTYRDQAEGDRLVLAQLRKAGADLAIPREVVQYLYFPTEDAARTASRSLSALGYSVDVDASADADEDPPNPWLALARAEMVVDEKWVTEMRPKMEEIAGASGGEYDGWEAAAD